MTPILSVLIPTVPSRREAAWKLFDKISAQSREYAGGWDPVEVLVLLDNKQRSTGLKRDALLQASRGKYVAFVDDDDDVSDNYVREIVKASATNAGVIVFDSDCFLNGQPGALITHHFGSPNYQYSPEGFTRGAWHIHAWRGEIARMVPFPDIQNGEDWPWCHAMKSLTATSTKIDEVLYHYRYDHETTEASK